jgi:uncharacterized protein (TIGR02246 family)
MANTTIEKELLGLEKRYWQAIKDRDADTALRLTDDDCIVTGPQGVASFDRKSFEQMMRNPGYEVLDFDVTDVEVRMLGDDVAVVAYKVHEELNVEGERLTIDAADSSTWVKRDDGWRCALHTEAIVGDPFGRDRRGTENGATKSRRPVHEKKTRSS